MKRNVVLAIALLAIAVVASGCAAGPWTCENTVRDWAADVYAYDTYLGTLNYYTVAPIGTAIGGVLDMVFVNTYWWWVHDVWEGTGTTFTHKQARTTGENK